MRVFHKYGLKVTYTEQEQLCNSLKIISQEKGSGIKDVKTIRREGNAAAEILHTADEENIDTIIIGSKGIKSVKEFLSLS